LANQLNELKSNLAARFASPRVVALLIGIGIVCAANFGEATTALKPQLEQISAQFGPPDAPFLKLAQESYGRGDYKDAEKQANLALAINPINSESKKVKGMALYRQKLFDDAVPELSFAYEMGQTDAEAQLALALCFQSYNRPRRCLDICESVKNSDVKDPRELQKVLWTEALCYAEVGEPREADKKFSEALNISHFSPHLVVDYIASLENQGELHRAYEIFQTYTRLHPGEPTLKQAKAKLRKLLYDRGYRELRLPGSPARPYLDGGYAFLLDGDYQGAFSAASRALQFQPNLASAYRIRGEALLLANERKLAAIELRQSLNLNPSDEYARFLAGSVK
jgi:Flp pilus assembly protein TadD